VELSHLIGHATAKVDDKGRIKIPTLFRRLIEERYGSDCFITSFDGESAYIYPIPIWRTWLAKLANMPSSNPAKRKMQEIANYYGQIDTMDAQGRLLVPAILRDVAAINEEVVVLGSDDHLIVWNEERFQKRLTTNRLTDDDFRELGLHGV
jgi:MraZ protein